MPASQPTSGRPMIALGHGGADMAAVIHKLEQAGCEILPAGGELTLQRVTREVKALCAKFPVYA